MQVVRLVLYGVFTTMLLSSRSYGQVPRPASDVETKLASQYTDDAIQQQNDGHYAAAFEWFRKAYGVVPEPRLLFDMAQALRRDSRIDEAIEYYRRYLEAEPRGRESRAANHWLAELQTAQAAQAAQADRAARADDARKPSAHPAGDRRKPDPRSAVSAPSEARSPTGTAQTEHAVAASSVGASPRKPEPPRKVELRGDPAAASEAQDTAAAAGATHTPNAHDELAVYGEPPPATAPAGNAGKPPPSLRAPAAGPPPPRVAMVTPGAPMAESESSGPVDQPADHRWQIIGFTTGGAGVAGLLVGIGYGMHALSLSNDLSKPGAVYDPAKLREGQRDNKIEVTGLVGGGALIAAGAAMAWWGYHTTAGGDRVTLAPVVSGQLAGLAIAGSL